MNTLLTTRPQWTLCHLQTSTAPHLTRPRRFRSSVFGGRLITRRFARVDTATVETEIVAASPPGAGTVRIIVKGRKLEVTESIRSYAEKKIAQALDHYAQSIKNAEVTLSVRGGDTGTKGIKEQKTEVTIWTLRNGVVRSEETASSLYASIDLVCDKVKHKLQKVKEIAMSKGKWPGRGGPKGAERLSDIVDPVSETLDLDEEIDWTPEIIRTKLFTLEPMDPFEAAAVMENLGHNFFVFQNKESKDVQVIYKRKEYGYGVIVPVIHSGSRE